jgi:uncharacterized protein YdeI (YjbR/CyaY-like superfamily)
MQSAKPKFFSTPAAWRAWLEKHHNTESEILVGFYKRDSGRPSITWPESVDQALCFGWIDGVRRRIDDESYTIRFTPRKPRGTWSMVNVKRVAELSQQGLMHEAGIKAFGARNQERSGIYSFEQRNIEFPPEYESLFRGNPVAWEFFETQPAWYRRTATWLVISAKKEETRRKRLAKLIDQSEKKLTLAELTRK